MNASMPTTLTAVIEGRHLGEIADRFNQSCRQFFGAIPYVITAIVAEASLEATQVSERPIPLSVAVGFSASCVAEARPAATRGGVRVVQ